MGVFFVTLRLFFLWSPERLHSEYLGRQHCRMFSEGYKFTEVFIVRAFGEVFEGNSSEYIPFGKTEVCMGRASRVVFESKS